MVDASGLVALCVSLIGTLVLATSIFGLAVFVSARRVYQLHLKWTARWAQGQQQILGRVIEAPKLDWKLHGLRKILSTTNDAIVESRRLPRDEYGTTFVTRPPLKHFLKQGLRVLMRQPPVFVCDTLCTSDSSVIKEILEDVDCCVKRSGSELKAMKHAMTRANGDVWRRQRRVIAKQLSFKRLDRLVPALVRHANGHFERFAQQMQNSNGGNNTITLDSPVSSEKDLIPLFQAVSLDAMLTIVLGGLFPERERCRELFFRMWRIHRRLSTDGSVRFPTDPETSDAIESTKSYPDHRSTFSWCPMLSGQAKEKPDDNLELWANAFAQAVDQQITARLTRQQASTTTTISSDISSENNDIDTGGCLLDALLPFIQELDATKTSSEATANTDFLLRSEVISNTLSFMIAGFETVAHAMAMTVMQIAQNSSELQARVVQEVDSVVDLSTLSTSVLDRSIINNCVLMERCIKEALRLYPPVMQCGRALIGRQPKFIAVQSENENEQKFIGCPVGINFFCDMLTLQREPLIWNDKHHASSAFDPDRWENLTEAQQAAYMPFATGPRMCVGFTYAMFELRSFLALFFRRFSVAPSSSWSPTFHQAPTLVLSNGLYVKITVR